MAVKLLLGPPTGLAAANMEALVDRALAPDNPILASLEKEASTLAGLRHPHILVGGAGRGGTGRCGAG